jgi:hypothetical protein
VECAVAHVVVFDNVLDANEALLARHDVSGQVLEVAMCLVATGDELVVIVAVLGDEVDDDLVGNHVLPVCAGEGRAAVEHHPGAGKVGAGLFDQVLDLGMLSSCSGREKGQEA